MTGASSSIDKATALACACACEGTRIAIADVLEGHINAGWMFTFVVDLNNIRNLYTLEH